MKKNVFLKSILRQRLRSLLLFFLITIAAFAFVLRTVEYIVIHRHINDVDRHYRAIGFLRSHNDTENIYHAANILAQSPYMGFEDRRRRFEGILQDAYSPDISGMPRHSPDVRLYSATYFYAELDMIFTGREEEGRIFLGLRVTDVLAGHPIYAQEGQWLWMYFRVDSPPGGDMSFLDEKEIGGIYLFKGHWYRSVIGLLPRWPRWYHERNISFTSRWHEHLEMQPLPSPEQIQADIESINRDKRAITLQTTRDMALMADIQGRSTSMRLHQGRVLNHNDYLEANPVAMIHREFATMFGHSLGDSLTVRVYHNQFVHSIALSTWEMEGMGMVDARDDYLIASTTDDRGYVEIELEIVGIFNHSYRTDNTYGFGIIYVPDSLIPASIYTQMPQANYLPAMWYGFVLNDTRHEQAFFAQYRDRLAEYDISLHMFRSGAEVFWAAADSILLVTAFNALIFGTVVLAVLALVSFVFVKQRHKEFAIARSLGVSVRKILLQICLSFFVIGFPAAAIGGGAAWRFAIQESSDVLEPFAEHFTPIEHRGLGVDFVADAIRDAAQPDFSYWILFFLIIGIFLFILAMVLLTVFTHIRRPVLEQLQGQSAAGPARVTKARFDEAVPDYDSSASTAHIKVFDAKPKPGVRFSSAMSWILTHIVRSPVKTILTAGVTLLFVIALGWLQESMGRTADNIEYLYDNTVVQVDLETHGIPFTAYERLYMLYESGHFDIFSPEATHNLTFIIPDTEHWQEQIGFDSTVGIQYNIGAGIFDLTLGTSDLDDFIAEHSTVLIGDEVLGLQIEFIQDFDSADFVYNDGTLTQLIPAILPVTSAEQWDLGLGDEFYLGYIRVAMALAEWTFVPAKVVGIHNQHIYMPGMEAGVIVPVGVIEGMLGPMTLYHALRLTVDTAFNRDIESARDTLEHFMVRNRGQGRPFMLPLEVNFFDEELRNMVGAMSQILLLLELLYPVALALAVIIGTAVFALLMLQSVKNAAIMRVQGASKLAAMATLCAEQFIVCMMGLLLGLGVLLLFSWGFGFVALLAVAGIYLAGVMAGSIVGALIITAKAPIDLLQVRE